MTIALLLEILSSRHCDLYLVVEDVKFMSRYCDNL